VTLEALSRRADAMGQRLSVEAGQVVAMRASVESAQKGSALALERISRAEAANSGRGGDLRSLIRQTKAGYDARGEALWD
jgi:hypothetical protein